MKKIRFNYIHFIKMLLHSNLGVNINNNPIKTIEEAIDYFLSKSLSGKMQSFMIQKIPKSNLANIKFYHMSHVMINKYTKKQKIILNNIKK